MMGFREPLAVALIGTGNRAQTVYEPLFPALTPWVHLVAVCDPVRENADAMAGRLGVPAFYSIHDLVRARPMEAALVVTPVPSHHSISCYLSENGIHNQVETSMASLLAQARQMVETARRNKVVLRVGENFFRFPFDRMAQAIDQTGFLGEIRRIVCLQDHTGYHNNSRWIRFYRAHPEMVQSVEHTMPVAPYYEAPHRYHTDEPFHCRFFWFPGDRLVVDLAANIKGRLGRHLRPGYTEFHGARGTIVQQAIGPDYQARCEVRYASDASLATGGWADETYPIVEVFQDGHWASSHVDLPSGRVEYVTPYSADTGIAEGPHHFYAATIMDHVVSFARAVREGAPSEYTDTDALAAM